jgi:hypothetical protein
MTQFTKNDANNSIIIFQFHDRGLVAISHGSLFLPAGQPSVAHSGSIVLANTLFELLATTFLGHG